MFVTSPFLSTFGFRTSDPAVGQVLNRFDLKSLFFGQIFLSFAYILPFLSCDHYVESNLIE